MPYTIPVVQYNIYRIKRQELSTEEGIASATATFKPARAVCSAAIIPAGPAPTIRTSKVSGWGVDDE